MKIQFVNDGEIRTTVPIVLVIYESSSLPQFTVDKLGKIPVYPFKDGFRAEFFVETPGVYSLKLISGKEVWNKEILVKEQKYLSFRKEFGFFSILFVLMMCGVVLWVRKIKKKSV